MDRAMLKKKVQKDNPTFTDSVDGLTVTDLEKNMLMYAKHKEDTEMALKEDEEIQDIQEQLKELKAPYGDAMKSLKMKMAYINILIREKTDGEPKEKEESAE
jgi:hypothetical protein